MSTQYLIATYLRISQLCPGQFIDKGVQIGNVGPKNVYGVPNNPYKDSSGNPTNGATTGCHLHLTIRKNGELVNPLTLFE